MKTAPGPKSRGLQLVAMVLTALVAVSVGFGAVYVMARAPDNGASKGARPAKGAEVAQALPAGAGANALSQGHMAAFVFKKTPEALPAVTFLDSAGKERTFADWKGRVVLVNLWATWCIPCRKEMPALERLQKELGSGTFEVVAISADRSGAEVAKKFLDGIKVTGLGLYADPSLRITSTLRAVGLPTTLLLDREGREIGRLVGPAEWDSADAKRLIEAAIKG